MHSTNAWFEEALVTVLSSVLSDFAIADAGLERVSQQQHQTMLIDMAFRGHDNKRDFPYYLLARSRETISHLTFGALLCRQTRSFRPKCFTSASSLPDSEKLENEVASYPHKGSCWASPSLAMTFFVTLFAALEDHHATEHPSDPKRVSDVGNIEPLSGS